MLEVLQQAFRTQVEGENRPFYISPSNLGRCGRELIISALGLWRFEPLGAVREILRDGHVFEERTLGVLEEGGFQILARQVPVFIPLHKNFTFLNQERDVPCPECGVTWRGRKPVMHGHIDAIGTKEGRHVLIEHKAVSEWTFKKARSEDFRGFYVFLREYIVQTGLYLLGCQKGYAVINPPGFRKFPGLEASLLIRNRNRPDFLSASITYDLRTDTLKVSGVQVMEKEVIRTLEISGTVQSFFRTVKRKLDIIAEVYQRLLPLVENLEEKTPETLFAHIRNQNEVQEILASASRKLPERLDKCGFCEAKAYCRALFSPSEFLRYVRQQENESNRVFLPGEEEKQLMQRLLELENRKKELRSQQNDIEAEIERIKTRFLETLDAYNGKVFFDAETGFFVEKNFRKGYTTVSASRLPEEILNYIKENAPEAVNENPGKFYVTLKKVKSEKQRRFFASRAEVLRGNEEDLQQQVLDFDDDEENSPAAGS